MADVCCSKQPWAALLEGIRSYKSRWRPPSGAWCYMTPGFWACLQTSAPLFACPFMLLVDVYHEHTIFGRALGLVRYSFLTNPQSIKRDTQSNSGVVHQPPTPPWWYTNHHHDVMLANSSVNLACKRREIARRLNLRVSVPLWKGEHPSFAPSLLAAPGFASGRDSLFVPPARPTYLQDSPTL